jgi:hypothetical protein
MTIATGEKMSPLITSHDNSHDRLAGVCDTVLQLGAHAIQFAGIKRAPRYSETMREDDAQQR